MNKNPLKGVPSLDGMKDWLQALGHTVQIINLLQRTDRSDII